MSEVDSIRRLIKSEERQHFDRKSRGTGGDGGSITCLWTELAANRVAKGMTRP